MSSQDPSFLEFLSAQGKIWVPTSDPPELGTVPLDPGSLSDNQSLEWLGKCSAWLAYAQSQLGLAEAQKALLQRRFGRMVNELIVSQQVKQRTYELQVAEVAREREDLLRIQEELGNLEAKGALWSRMARAYEVYVRLFQEDVNKRRWSRPV